MTSNGRFVIDTNVLISASLFAKSTPREAVDAARRRGRLLVSRATFDELNDVLLREKLDRYISRERRIEFLAALAVEVDLIEVA
jgi:uncharacterized protein